MSYQDICKGLKKEAGMRKAALNVPKLSLKGLSQLKLLPNRARRAVERQAVRKLVPIQMLKDIAKAQTEAPSHTEPGALLRLFQGSGARTLRGDGTWVGGDAPLKMKFDLWPKEQNISWTHLFTKKTPPSIYPQGWLNGTKKVPKFTWDGNPFNDIARSAETNLNKVTGSLSSLLSERKGPAFVTQLYLRDLAEQLRKLKRLGINLK